MTEEAWIPYKEYIHYVHYSPAMDLFVSGCYRYEYTRHEYEAEPKIPRSRFSEYSQCQQCLNRWRVAHGVRRMGKAPKVDGNVRIFHGIRKMLSKRKCSHPKCTVTGVAYVPEPGTAAEKPHYCITHNQRIKNGRK